MLNLKDIFKKAEDNWVSRFIVDEVVIMPLCRSEDDIQYIYSICDETGLRIWQLLDGTHSAGDIQEILKREFKGHAEAIERGVLEFLEDLIRVRLIEKSGRRKSVRTENLASRNDSRLAGKKKPYKIPEITKVKMQPEQAVLACCLATQLAKTKGSINVCAATGYFCTNCGTKINSVTSSSASLS